ncbi:hypothetical protein KFL_002900150 [Klebsormidium nitens]|uniref:Uncharacterized protein n=1 Tax=Klebsormidium nitens TaxID=105231 RepID=A0A1Y1I931_KLENI|nr:hypothetical protein KFL_002900150 [Klebsormidium nitens]|eukprot:GAQ86462.1 hypothetical protein KFL_002900150 [Klebsormidium nitens]
MKPWSSTAAHVGFLTLFVLCLGTGPLAHAQDTCASSPHTASITCTRDCSMESNTGIAGFWYAFLTDIGLQINAKLVGPIAECPEKMTWLEEIAVVWIDESGKKRSLAVKIDQEANWYEQDVFQFESDEQSVEAPAPATKDASSITREPDVAWMADDGSASVLRVPNEWNTSVLSVPDVIMVHISSDVDEWIQGSADPLGAYGKYLDMSIKYVRPLYPSVHGIIGQMLQPNAYEIKMAIETSNKEKRERVDGDDDLYEVAGLADTECHFCRFDQALVFAPPPRPNPVARGFASTTHSQLPQKLLAKWLFPGASPRSLPGLTPGSSQGSVLPGVRPDSGEPVPGVEGPGTPRAVSPRPVPKSGDLLPALSETPGTATPGSDSGEAVHGVWALCPRTCDWSGDSHTGDETRGATF